MGRGTAEVRHHDARVSRVGRLRVVAFGQPDSDPRSAGTYGPSEITGLDAVSFSNYLATVEPCGSACQVSG